MGQIIPIPSKQNRMKNPERLILFYTANSFLILVIVDKICMQVAKLLVFN